MKNKSTLHPYRATLVTKPDLRRALLVVEARGRSCPMVSVIRGLNEVNADGLRLRVMAHLADKAAFLDYIRTSQIKQVTFAKLAGADIAEAGRSTAKLIQEVHSTWRRSA